MSAIVPPLDYIPKLPALGVNKVVEQLDKVTDSLVRKVTDTVENAAKLPENCNCNDPRVKDIKKQIQDAQKLITDMQQSLAKIQQTVATVQRVVSTAKKIKAVISLAQLFNPITAPVFIAGQLTAIQDATIVNAVQAVQQFSAVPPVALTKIAAVVPQLTSVLAQIASACNGNVQPLEVASQILDQTKKSKSGASGDGSGGDGSGGDGSGGNGSGGDNDNSDTPGASNSGNASSVPITVNLYNESQQKSIVGQFSIIQKNKKYLIDKSSQVSSEFVNVNDNAEFNPDNWYLRIVEPNTQLNALRKQKLNELIRVTCPSGNSFLVRVISINKTINTNQYCAITLDKLAGICAQNLGDIDFNSFLDSEFYNSFNVSSTDLSNREQTIDSILKQQQDLLNSILEAPSKAYQGDGLPSPSLGKTGDYYIDLTTNNVYGPKFSIDSWDGVTFATSQPASAVVVNNTNTQSPAATTTPAMSSNSVQGDARTE